MSTLEPEILPPGEQPSARSAEELRRERGLLGFYERLRRRLARAIEKGRLPPGTSDWLLLVPDVFVLLVRLSLDKEVPRATRSLIGGALAYFILPIDLWPEAVVGPVGFLDDLVLAASVLAHVMSPQLEPLAEKYWSGRQKLRVVLRDIARSAEGLLGEGLLGRVERWLEKRGIGRID